MRNFKITHIRKFDCISLYTGCLHRHRYEAKLPEHQQWSQTISQGTVDHPILSTTLPLTEVIQRRGPSQKSAPIYVHAEVFILNKCICKY